MPKLEPMLAYFRQILAQEERLTRETIRSIVIEGPFSVTAQDREVIVRTLEASFDITQQLGSIVRADYRPWLAARKPELSFYYWDRLSRYLGETGTLPRNVLNVLHGVTDEILDYCGNPADPLPWARRGMVIGHVQSGKTTNYAALICKAADAGYKVVILLAGTTNSLRQQTQERMDELFIGKKSVFQAQAEALSIVNYSDVRRFPAYGTSRSSDFSTASATAWGVTLAALNEPIIFVTKKNPATLDNLLRWLGPEGSRIDEPLLMIDDEADNASVNTSANPTAATTINQAIREILKKFNRSTYIGYTATPFANIFIDPKNQDSMSGDDLFPRHFIKALDPPSNYMGANRFFPGNGERPTELIREVQDFSALLPLVHKKDHRPAALWGSLSTAIQAFVVARAIRVLRNQGAAHCSMMINVSRFNDVQDHMSGLVYGELEKLKAAIVVNAGLGRQALLDPAIQALKNTLTTEFAHLDVDFDEILPHLPEAITSIRIVVVNMKGGTLEYRRHAAEGLHVIAIGGLALSRGLTLEGLTVSYILRNSGAYDTLMQMARWFGYRPGYEDLCRLYLPDESLTHYEFIADAIEELRAEVRSMEEAQLTPQTFGLKVRQSPYAIRITAANKMRTASELVVAQDYSCRMIEGYALENHDSINAANRGLVETFLAQLGDPSDVKPSVLFWRAKAYTPVRDLLSKFVFSASHPDLGVIQGTRSLFMDYVFDRFAAELSEWDIALPCYDSEDGVPVAGRTRRLVERHACVVVGNALKLTSKNKAANPGDERLGLTESELAGVDMSVRGAGKYCSVRARPLLLVHIVDASPGAPADDRPSQGALNINGPVVSLSFCLPGTSVDPIERTYQVTAVYRQLLLEENQPDEDEGFEETNRG